MGRTRAWMSTRGWWISFAVLLAVALVFSTVVGNYVARLKEPVEVGTSVTGEWADLAEYGFRARLDSLELSTTYPSSSNAGDPRTAPEGATYLRVRMSIEPLVAADADMGCFWELFNSDGEQLTMTEFGVDGPLSRQCTYLELEGSRELEVPFTSQEVYVVVPDDVESYTLQLSPQFGDKAVFWTFTAS